MPQQDLPRTVGFIGGVGLLLGVIIGSGIYQTPAEIAGHLGSPTVILAMWVAGGVLSLFGALSYAELGAAFPRSGGIYSFLYQGFGAPLAFTFGWTYTLITKPFAASAIATIFAKYLGLNALLGGQWAEPVAVCVLLVVLTWINVRGVRLGAGAGVVLTTIKVLSLAAICFLAVLLPGGSVENFAPGESPQPLLTSIAPVMMMVLWSYDGWSDVGAIAGEIKNPQRTLPRIYILGTGAAIAIYLAVNAAYLYVLPLEVMRISGGVATALMERLVGPGGALIVAGMVVVSTVGSTHASVLTGARVSFAQSQDGLLFRFLSRVHPRYRTPSVALWVQCGLSCTAVLLLQDFARLAGGFIFTMWIFYGLAAAAVIVLRIRRPQLERPYRCVGYPLVPGLFVLASATMTVLLIIDSPANTLPWLAVLAAGWPAYWLWKRYTGPR
jgi:APA family basic amino acid/polyamine antiporter